MSIKQMTLVFEDSTLKGNAKLLMLAIADNCNDTGVCFPSWGVLIKKTSMSKGSISKWIKYLEDKKLLFRKTRNRLNGSRTSNKYLIYPLVNKYILDEEDYEIFKDLFIQSSEVEPPSKVQKLNHPSSEVELANGGQSSEVEHLEPSLIYLTTTTNHHLGEESGINPISFNEWVEYKKCKNKGTIKKIKNFLSKYPFRIQQQIVDNSIMNGYKGLFEPKVKRNTPTNTPNMQQLNPDVNIWEKIETEGQLNG